jgi:cytochrome P450
VFCWVKVVGATDNVPDRGRIEMESTVGSTWPRSDVRAGLPPGPRLPSILQALQVAARPASFLPACARRYGDAFTLKLPGLPPEVHFSDPDAVRTIFSADPEVLCAGESNGILEPVVGKRSLLLLDGARHLRERRLMLPPFHGERMQAYGSSMREITERAVASWPLGRPFRLHPAMQALTLEVILRTVFGVPEGERFDRLRDVLKRFLTVSANPFWLMPWLQWDLGPRSAWGRFVRLRQEAHELLLAEIAGRRAGGEAGDDVLSLLLAARDENGVGLDDAELRDEMMTLLLAGHETTATALAWVAHRLLEHPDVLVRVKDEIRRGAGFEYLDAVVKETLRLHPVLTDVGRLVRQPIRIGGWDLPAGVIAVPSIYLTQRRPDRWPDPERFLPDRFVGTRPAPYEFFPFGGGLRRCLGMAFALYEMRIVLAEMLARVAIRPVPGVRIRPVRRSITLTPSGGMPVLLERVDTAGT